MRVLLGILTTVALVLALPVTVGLVALASMFLDSGYPADRPWGVLMLLAVGPFVGIPMTGTWLAWRSHRRALGAGLLLGSVALSGGMAVLLWAALGAAATP